MYMPPLLVIAIGVAIFLVLRQLFRRSNELTGRVTQLETAIWRLRQELEKLHAELARKSESAPAPVVPAQVETVAERVEVATTVTTTTTEQVEPAFIPAASLSQIAHLPSSDVTAMAPPPLPSPASQPESPAIPSMPVNWEQFLGARLFAWLGGLVLFLGIAFFIKYSFEHNLIPPWVRVAGGFIVGAGLIGGGLLMRRKEYAVTSQTLCATGVVVLYATAFAAHSSYHLVSAVTAFALMSVVTAVALVLAARTKAKVIAVLGLVAGFLTPPLLSTGEDNPGGLFGYIALLDIGLLVLAIRQEWFFLSALGVGGTILLETGWALRFF